MKTTKNTWVIYVSGYGSFFFEGTQEEAEEMRVNKANWEGGIGRKRLATKEEIENDDPSYRRRKTPLRNLKKQ